MLFRKLKLTFSGVFLSNVCSADEKKENWTALSDKSRLSILTFDMLPDLHEFMFVFLSSSGFFCWLHKEKYKTNVDLSYYHRLLKGLALMNHKTFKEMYKGKKN